MVRGAGRGSQAPSTPFEDGHRFRHVCERFAQRCLAVALTVLIAELAHLGLDAVARGPIVEDFEFMRQALFFMLTVKFAHWGQLPWVIMGIAHHSRHKAKRCLRRAYWLFDHSPQGTVFHWLAEFACTPGSRARIEGEMWLAGAPLDAVPFFERLAGRCRFVLTSERWIESQHARTAKTFDIAHHLGFGVYTNF